MAIGQTDYTGKIPDPMCGR